MEKEDFYSTVPRVDLIEMYLGPGQGKPCSVAFPFCNSFANSNSPNISTMNQHFYGRGRSSNTNYKNGSQVTWKSCVQKFPNCATITAVGDL